MCHGLLLVVSGEAGTLSYRNDYSQPMIFHQPKSRCVEIYRFVESLDLYESVRDSKPINDRSPKQKAPQGAFCFDGAP
jgi:hypothetical protein